MVAFASDTASKDEHEQRVKEFENLMQLFGEQFKDNPHIWAQIEALPSPDMLVLYHRTEWFPERIFQSGLGFGLDITSTATVHYHSEFDAPEVLLDALHRRHRYSQFVIVCEIPIDAYLRREESEAGINIKSDFLVEPPEGFSAAVSPSYIKGAINQFTGEWIPNPNWIGDTH